MAFNHNPSAMAMSPVVLDPALVLTGRTLVAARIPDVVVAIIALIAANPDRSTLGWRATALVNGRGRADANCNLRKRSRRSQRECEQ